MSDSIALYGGSFDPIHHGHLIVARAVAERLHASRVVFLPAAAPPHKGMQELGDPRHRGEMVRLAIRNDALFAFSDFDLHRTGPHYTIDTVVHFRREFGPDADLCWIIGADSLAELGTWHRVAELVDACRIITAARPANVDSTLFSEQFAQARACDSGPGRADCLWGSLQEVVDDSAIAKLKANMVPTPLIDISSTDIRRRIRAKQPISYLVPESVAMYIDAHGLYR